MGEEVRRRRKAGEGLPVGSMKIPMVDLPLGATEDRVCGTIDIEKALTEGAGAARDCMIPTAPPLSLINISEPTRIRKSSNPAFG